MKITHSITAAMLIFVLTCCISNTYAQQGQEQKTPETERTTVDDSEDSQEQTISRARTDFVKTVNFYLRDGELVSGKLLSEDKNEITVEKLDGSRTAVVTFSKRQVDTRTVNTRNVRTYRYYTELGEYFAARTWDFRDDPDDFIQAIRCYEQAVYTAAEAPNSDGEKVEQIKEKLKQLEADREVWIEQMQSRHELRKLEFETELEKRLTELEEKIERTSQSVERALTAVKEDYRKLRDAVKAGNENVYRQLNILERRIEDNREAINEFYYRTGPYPYPRYYSPKRRSLGSEDKK